MPVYKLLGGPIDPRGVRGYYHAGGRTLEELAQAARDRRQPGRHAASRPASRATTNGSKPTHKIDARGAISWQMLREGAGAGHRHRRAISTPRPAPRVASIIVKEVEPLNLLFIEEPCPPENVKAMARIRRRSTTPIATGERLVAAYGCRELIEMGVVDIIQTDINHVGGITALWKVGAMAEASGISMAPHACEGPDRRPGHAARGCRHAQLPGAGDLQRRRADREGQGLGGVARLPGHAHGQRPVPAAREARPGLRPDRGGAEEVPVRRHPRRWPASFHEDGSVAEW